jgi:hypothetical protein
MDKHADNLSSIDVTTDIARQRDVTKDSPDPSIAKSSATDTLLGTVSKTSNIETTESEPVPEATLSPTAEEAHPSWQETAQALADQALQFLSTASNETIGACLVGLSATTYLVLGRVGLVLIGVVGGVVLHATWEGSHGISVAQARADEEKRRKEIGLDVVKRAFAWRDARLESSTEDNTEVRIEFIGDKDLDFSSLPPESAAALTELTDAIVRDYVKYVACVIL